MCVNVFGTGYTYPCKRVLALEIRTHANACWQWEYEIMQTYVGTGNMYPCKHVSALGNVVYIDQKRKGRQLVSIAGVTVLLKFRCFCILVPLSLKAAMYLD